MVSSEKVYKELKSKIISGELVLGDYLPSENELSKIYDLSRSTIRKVLNRLKYEGYIKKEQGKGSRVVLSDQMLNDSEFRENKDQFTGRRMDFDVLTLQQPIEITWPKNFYYPLDLQEYEAGCTFFNRIYVIDKNVAMTDFFYIPNTYVKNLIRKDLISNSVIETLEERYEVKITKKRSDYSAIYADLKTSMILNTFPGAPLIKVYTLYETNIPGYKFYSFFYYNTEHYLLSENIRVR